MAVGDLVFLGSAQTRSRCKHLKNSYLFGFYFELRSSLRGALQSPLFTHESIPNYIVGIIFRDQGLADIMRISPSFAVQSMALFFLFESHDQILCNTMIKFLIRTYPFFHISGVCEFTFNFKFITYIFVSQP
jgi:hypothetical protein